MKGRILNLCLTLPAGAVVGAYVGARSHPLMRGDGPGVACMALVGGAIGFIAGCLIGIAEPPHFIDDAGNRRVDPRDGTVLGRVLALIAMLLVWAPGVGLGLNAAAASLNHRVRGWPRVTSRIGITPTCLLHAGFAVLIVIDALNG